MAALYSYYGDEMRYVILTTQAMNPSRRSPSCAIVVPEQDMRLGSVIIQ